MKAKSFLRIFAAAIAVLCLLTIPASASSPYKSYVYDNNGVFTAAPDAFRYDSTVQISKITDKSGNEIGALNLFDSTGGYSGNIFAAADGRLYIADTGNQRIIVLNSDYSFYKIIDGFKNTITNEDGTTKTFDDTFRTPTYVFVDGRDGSIYICDQNGATLDNVDVAAAEVIRTIKEETQDVETREDFSGRVIQLDKDGNFIRQIAGIDSEVLPDDFIFQPTKMVVDNAGRIFILSNQCNQGIVELSESGEFVQTLGAAKVTYSAAELVQRMFMTKEQKEETQDFVPTEYSSIAVDEDNFLFVTNSSFDKTTVKSIERVCKLNAKGKNVIKTPSSLSKPYGDYDVPWTGNYKGDSTLVDVMCLDNGVYAVLDSLRGRVFFYNTDGVNLFEFGTTADYGDGTHMTYVDGMLNNPLSFAWFNDTCIVLDGESGNIKIFTMTDYAKLIFQANEYHVNSEWDKEEDCWREVLKLNLNSAAAKQNIAKVFYRKGDWDTAMSYFKDIVDQENYSKAYKYKRQEIIEQYFLIAMIVLIAVIVLIIIIKKLWKKYIPPVKEHSYFGHLKYAGTLLGRPLNGSWFLVRENHASVASATTILVAAAIMNLLQARYTGFIFNAYGEYVNIILELLTIIAPIMLFVVCNWCVTSLLNGEGNFRAIYIGSCYSLTPILILYPFAILFSNIMVMEEGDFYSIFITIAYVLVLFLLFCTNMRIHDYNPGFTVLELFITVVVMVLVVFLAVLFFALVQQMYDFATRLIQEIATRS